MNAPFWVCPVMAAITFSVFRYILPVIMSIYPQWNVIGTTLQSFAPISAFIVLLIGVCAWLRRLRTGLMLDHQKGSNTIAKLTWCEFEELIAAAYRRQGYRVKENGGGGADGGIDIILHRDGVKTLVQCKHWHSYKVGVKPVRELHGLTHSREYAGCRGLFVTFGDYTKEARLFAQDNGIELLGGLTLVKLIRSAQQAGAMQSKPEVPDESSTSCPTCGSSMVARIAKRGNKAGSKFWGCSRYPECRGIREC